MDIPSGDTYYEQGQGWCSASHHSFFTTSSPEDKRLSLAPQPEDTPPAGAVALGQSIIQEPGAPQP